MPEVTNHSDFGPQENKDGHCFCCFPIYLPWSALLINLFHMDSFPKMWIIPYYGEIHRKCECCVTLWSKWREIWGPHVLVRSVIVVRCHHWLNGHDFEQTLGDGEGQGSRACCGPWGGKESDTTEWLNNINNNLGKRPEILLHIPRCTGQPPEQGCLVQNANSALRRGTWCLRSLRYQVDKLCEKHLKESLRRDERKRMMA